MHSRCVATRNKNVQAKVKGINRNTPVMEQATESLDYVCDRINILLRINREYQTWKKQKNEENENNSLSGRTS